MEGLLWELVQLGMIGEARAEARYATYRADRNNLGIDEAQRRAERLALICSAMWALMRDRLGCTDAELLAKVREIDLRDGQLDGRGAPSPRACRSCGRPVAPTLGTCIYCATENPPQPGF